MNCRAENGSDLGFGCRTGYCCEERRCCPYYYELWWFWFIWVVAILLSFCCAYHHKRKSRQTGFRTSPLYDNHDIYSGACNYPGPPLDNKSEMMGYTKLPIYDDVIRIPPTASPPPPYSSRRQPVSTVAYVQRDENHGASLQIVECNITSSMLSLASLSHYIPDILTKANISFGSSGCNNNGTPTSNNTTTTTQNSQSDAIILEEDRPEHTVVVESEVVEGVKVESSSTDEESSSSTEACSSRNSLMSNPEESESSPLTRVIVRSINDIHLSADDLDYDSDSDVDDEWLMNGADRNNNIDPNNNNVVVDIEKLQHCNTNPSSADKVDNDVLTSPKNQDVSPMASIQDLIEDPQAY